MDERGIQYPGSSRRRRDDGLARVRAWTRRSIAAGVVVSGALGAGFAHLLPGQAEDRHPAAPPAGTRPSAPSTAEPAAPSRTPAATRHRLAPPSAPPSAVPAPGGHRTHATSGGS